MKLFLFEYATCGSKVPESIAVEGLAMYKTLLYGFSKYFSIASFVREEFSHLFEFPVGRVESMEEFLEKSDCFLIVAPEDEFTLLNLTRKAEKFCENLGSSSKAIEITSDKWRLYKKLKGRVSVPKTSKKPLKETFIVKPRVSCGGENIGFASKVEKSFIAQEYINGINLSVSLAVDEDIRVLSVNEQILDSFRYMGAIVPARIDKDTYFEVCREAIVAVDRIKGLKGYVGVDIVYSDQPYVIEINARLTTPSIAFEKAYGANVADLIMGKEKRFVRRQRIEKGNFSEFFAKVGDFAIKISDV